MELQSVFDKVKDKTFPYITMENLMTEMDVSYSTLRRMMLEGLPHYKRGKKIYFNPNKVQNWFDDKYSVVL
ncbi:helix-turn-helix domain-containing protein [Candidatus Marinimicrobia bacterium]|jgi:hypothetical protein|nr:helix-turn-helix domain-containing protein [Candidatus Neomarinimicrobiota bacterium]MDA9935039.1 helix-turn-helix domain-containing protein [Candidatus Neomarinimicrobiota bacterium]|tara:strand:- start:124 stop:336 length:213 start_codon:yes stop_codon:yes gene_type:complete